MTRGLPGAWSALRPPDRGPRVACRIICPTCKQDAATRSGIIAGHFDRAGDELCTASSMPVPADLKEKAR